MGVLLAISAGVVAQGVNPVRWSFSDNDVKAAPRVPLTVHVTAEIEPGWHLYGMKKIEEWPIPTTLVLDQGQAFKRVKDLPKFSIAPALLQ